ncbi:ankyrin repeat domain-containing protein [Auritidibacter ignavus]|uniref:ankyrin repeat domain-containing protein n=1 Tax=Auritidibacter ignavus TaxID=678932 RepID=UPI00109D43C2|nr:ankyrin repeat domain-containing protein [Auritidibacter ignavus]
MADSATPTPEHSGPEPALSDEQIEFLHTLFDAAREGKVQMLSSAIDQGIPVNLANANGDTFLILATYRNQPEVVSALLERGAEVNATNQRGQSALTCAVFLQDKGLVQQLLEAGADPELGAQSARATVEFMDLPAMKDVLDQHQR